MRSLVVVVFVLACGGAQKPQRAPGMRELAAEIDAESAALARVIHDHRGDCARMASELRAVFARMNDSFSRARKAQQDPALAKELTTELRAYDTVTKQRDAQIEADIAEDSRCVQDPAVRDAMLAMPTL